MKVGRATAAMAGDTIRFDFSRQNNIAARKTLARQADCRIWRKILRKVEKAALNSVLAGESRPGHGFPPTD